jgi:branched-chain amino acid transport system permease protein
MWDEAQFALSLVVSGLSIGLMYSLIALGFVLVYKATDAINFAQGEFVMLAGFVAAVTLSAKDMPAIAAVATAVAVMVLFSFALERIVLRPLLGRPIIAVIMATIGLGAMLRGLPPITVGGETRALPLPIGDTPVALGPATLPPIQIAGVVVTFALLGIFSWFFLKSRMGIAMRAVADNQQVAMAMGINVERYFALAWAMAGIVSALGGVIWGSMLGVDVHLALIGLKVFPVVILGGLDSIVGAVVGGVIIGVVESLAAGYLDPYVGGGTKDFAPCCIASPASSRPAMPPTWRSIRCPSRAGRSWRSSCCSR